MEVSMNEGVKVPPAPTVYCPKDSKEVPIWYCLGSFTQGRERCLHIIKATVFGGERAEVECKWEKKDEDKH